VRPSATVLLLFQLSVRAALSRSAIQTRSWTFLPVLAEGRPRPMCLALSQSVPDITHQNVHLPLPEFRMSRKLQRVVPRIPTRCNLQSILAQPGVLSGGLEIQQPLFFNVYASPKPDSLFERIMPICRARGESMARCASDPWCVNYSLLHIDSKGAMARLSSGVPIQ